MRIVDIDAREPRTIPFLTNEFDRFFLRTMWSDAILLARLPDSDSTRLKYSLSSAPNPRNHVPVPNRLSVRGCIASSGIRHRCEVSIRR